MPNYFVMRYLEVINKRVSEETWKYPILVGLISIPFTSILQWLSIEKYIFIPVLLAGFVIGSKFHKRQLSSRRAGWRTGIIGGLVIIGFSFRFLTVIFDSTQSFVWTLFLGILLVLITAIYILVFGIIGAIGGIVGGILTERFIQHQPPSTN
jgi:peptidoglycan/LPS O-acetylase OafA/YrhL